MSTNLLCIFDDPSRMFTPEELLTFTHEGWDIFETDDRYQIQRLDEEAVLSDDATAWRLVWNRAMEGSIPHLKALSFLHQFSPDEYNLILAECKSH